MNIFDTHCHYNLEPITTDWQAHWQRAQEVGVKGSIIVGTTLASSQLALQQATAQDALFASVGIHPMHAHKVSDLEKEIFTLQKMTADSKVVAIGEVGLDYYHLSSKLETQKIKEIQKNCFIAMINLANQAGLPLILHVRDRGDEAYEQTLEIIEAHWNFQNSLVFHCVSGPLTYIRKALQLPKSYFGFDGNLTFKNAEYQREIFTLVKEADPKKILLETDAPYLAPEPYRGKSCEPYMIAQTATYAREQLRLDLNLTYQNTLQAFGIIR